MDATPPTKNRSAGPGWLVLLVPASALIVFFVWLLATDTADHLRAGSAERAREDRALRALDATPPSDVAALRAARGRPVEAWSGETRRAVAELVARTDWPPEAAPGSGRMLADRPTETWTAEELDAVGRLLDITAARFAGR